MATPRTFRHCCDLAICLSYPCRRSQLLTNQDMVQYLQQIQLRITPTCRYSRSHCHRQILLTRRLLAFTDEKTKKTAQNPTCRTILWVAFKNPPGNFAGKLLAEAGMKGFSCGGASFSTVHANFIVNHGNATAQDYYCLIRQGQRRVMEQFGVQMDLEIELLGEFQDVG